MFPSASREASRIGQIAVLPDRSNLGRRVHLKDLLGNRQLRDSMRHEVLVRVAFRSNVRSATECCHLENDFLCCHCSLTIDNVTERSRYKL